MAGCGPLLQPVTNGCSCQGMVGSGPRQLQLEQPHWIPHQACCCGCCNCPPHSLTALPQPPHLGVPGFKSRTQGHLFVLVWEVNVRPCRLQGGRHLHRGLHAT